MIRISQIKLPIPHSDTALQSKIASLLHIKEKDIISYEILRRSIEARKKEPLSYVYTVSVNIKNENTSLQHCKTKQISKAEQIAYRFPASGDQILHTRPIVIGSGPAGLFCAYELALHGYQPILLERGDDVDTRTKKIDYFWNTGVLDTSSNVQFGEGGAGTFSDGKLNTGVKDKSGRNRRVLETFVECGAPESILYDARPHLGTDQLRRIVKNMRDKIIVHGGDVRFRSQVTDFRIQNDHIKALCINNQEWIPCDAVVLAIGHSARDTFFRLYECGTHIIEKAFAVGIRTEHLQEMITRNQYGEDAPQQIGPASYKLSEKLPSGRGVYSFCMCPGGYVVNASSEAGMLAVNGMSYSGRSSQNANSAIVVTVDHSDFTESYTDLLHTTETKEKYPEPLIGIAFQRTLEQKAYQLCDGAIPSQRFIDFQNGRKGGAGSLVPCHKGQSQYADLSSIFPEHLKDALISGIKAFDRKIPGFAADDVILSGVESRTSSPVRILRNECFESNISGLYPCGEGAGYAGGITSAAMDGIRIAEAIAIKYRTLHEI